MQYNFTENYFKEMNEMKVTEQLVWYMAAS